MATQKSLKSLRFLLLAAEVKTNPWQTVQALCRTLGISRAQFYRDKDALKEIDFVFDYNRTQGRFVIEKDPYLPVYDLTLTETFALSMAVRQLSAAGDYVLTYDALKAIKKIVANAPGTQRDLLVDNLNEAVLQQGFGCQPQVLEDLHRAVLEQQQVQLTYTRPADGIAKTHVVNPYQIYFKRRALYVDVFHSTMGKYLMYRVNRISLVRFTGIKFSRHDDYNFAQRHRNAFSVFVGDAVQKVRVHFTKAIAPLIRETCWHHSQRFTDEKDGTLLFEVEVNDPREVGWWVLGWGAEAEVLEPESLRQELRETAERLIGLYRKKRPRKKPAPDDAMGQ